MKNDGEVPDALRETSPSLDSLPAPDTYDPVIEAYKRDVDRSLIRENLKLSYRERLKKLERTAAAMVKWRGAARRSAPEPGREIS